jgi:hypothetical protein
MNHLSDGMRGLSFILWLNRDRLFVVAAVFIALAAATWVAHP